LQTKRSRVDGFFLGVGKQFERLKPRVFHVQSTGDQSGGVVAQGTVVEEEHRGLVVKEKLAHKYHQPKGVEQFGIEPIPEDLKTVKWYDLFVIVVNFLLNPGMILIGTLAVTAGLSFWAGLTSVVLGIVIAFGAYIVMATLGVDYGLPGQVSTRMSYGIRGAKWIPSAVRTVSSIYWFAFQTLAGALGIVAVLNAWLGVKFSLITVSLVFAILQVAVALVGYDTLKNLSRVAFPVKIVILSYLLYLLMTYDVPNYAPGEVFAYTGTAGWKWAVFSLWVGSVASAWLSMITDAADFCRYSSTRLDMWVGTMLAAVVGTIFSAFFGAYAAAATLGKVANPFEVVTGVTTSGIALFLLLLVIALDNWTINVLNLYTGGLSLANIFTKLGRFWTTFIVSVAGVALSIIPGLVNGYTGFMSAFGSLFAPIAGVLITDYVFIKRARIDVLALFDRNGPYWYIGGFNPVAVAWTALGLAVFWLLPQTAVPIITAAVITGIGYYVTVRAVASKSPAVDAAARPGRQYEDVSAADVDLQLVEQATP
jgi:nucleobase:cation symporter-1, NCS1 family